MHAEGRSSAPATTHSSSDLQPAEETVGREPSAKDMVDLGADNKRGKMEYAFHESTLLPFRRHLQQPLYQ